MIREDMTIGPEHKSFPPTAWGSSIGDYLATEPSVCDFQTPLLTIDRSALEHNVRTMAQWLSPRGLAIAPHGKTTMAPQLWQQLLDSGAWGLTLATAWQVQLARSVGISRILLANTLIDPVALRWLVTELVDPEFDFSCWVDSIETVVAMRKALEGVQLPRPVPVIAELGGAGGRTGARTIEDAVRVAEAIESSPVLTLAGVGGYEGSLASERSPAALAGLVSYLDSIVALHEAIDWKGQRPIVTAGGSAYFDVVAERFAPLVGRANVVLRSGAYQVHDDGYYSGISPFAEGPTPFRAAIHGWARVISRPEAGLAIIDGGKRDFPYDTDLPSVQLVAGLSASESADALRAGRITKVNDQHAYLALAGDAELQVGAVVRMGLSHPCTAFDKWRLIPVVEGPAFYDSRVVDIVRTWF